MALSVSDFWKLLVQSRLLTKAQCEHLSSGFSAVPGAATAPGKTLAEWLVKKNILSKYQAVILLAGRAGPFFYGDYKIYDRLDSGRLAGAFRAVHVGTNHPVLLRFLAPGSTAQNPQAWAEVQRWIPATAHPNLARCFAAVDLGSYRFLVYEDLRGQSVADLLERSKRIAADEASRLGRMAALGLSYLHERGLVHGDVRPQNLFLEQTGNLKVLVDAEAGTRSFSLVTVANEPDGVARADYAAPEFLQAGRVADRLTDIYALGCSLYQLVAGQPPFAGGDPHSKMQRHAMEAIKPLDSVGAPPALTQVIAYSMAKNPAVRFQQAMILADQLVPFIGAAEQNLKAAKGSATLPAYEQWLLQQPAAAPMPEVSPVPGMVGPVPVVGLVSPVVAVATPTVGAVAASVAAPVVGPALAVGPVAASVPSPTKSSAAAIAIKRRARARKRNNLIFLTLSILAVCGALGGAYYFINTHSGLSAGRDPHSTVPDSSSGNPGFAPPSEGAPPQTGNPSPASNGASTKVAQNTAAGGGPASAEAVKDDGQTLWSSPTAGQPISLKYVPPGAQLFLVTRPSALMSREEGQRVLKALGPKFVSGRQSWETASGVKLDDVEQLIIALYANQGKFPKAACVVRLKVDTTPEDLRSKWGATTPADGLTGVVQKGEWAYYLPTDDKRTFVMGPLDPEFKDAAAANWKAPLLRREIGQLLQVSDDQRHLTVLFAPNFLFGDGQELFSGDFARAMRPLEWFLGTGLKSGLVSLHFDEHFYFEMRMESDIQTDRFQLASHVRERMAEIPAKVESYIAELNPHPYWRLVAFRYPAMVRFLHHHTRIGVDGSHAMLNSVLPIEAAHNLVFGGEMVIASTPGVSVAAAGPAKPSGPKTLEELLKSRISVAFAQDSLEFAMQNIVTEAKSAYPEMSFDFQIKILGSDLEKDGITRNQQVRDFNQQDKAVQEILTAMVMKANPITTVKAPNELDQKLIWVVGPNPDNPAQQIVLITTRAAASQKKYDLPEAFRPK